MHNKTIKLNNGYEMPVVGLGTYRSKPGQVEDAIKYAIDIGYRHFDCAYLYGNESEVGQAIKSKIDDQRVKREEIFVTSKLWNNFHARDKVVPMLEESLNLLGLEYIDLYLIHWPMAFKENAPLLPTANIQEAYDDISFAETWKGMEECVNLGLAKSIGVSNFNSTQVTELMKNAIIKPVVNQVECNPNINQKKLREFCGRHQIVLTDYCPLGRSEYSSRPGYPEPTMFDPKVIAIGEKYGKTSAQVVLNYLISLGDVVIPKSVTNSRILENISIFDFTLDQEDVVYLNSCNKNKRACPLLQYADHKDYPFSTEF